MREVVVIALAYFVSLFAKITLASVDTKSLCTIDHPACVHDPSNEVTAPTF